MIGINSNLPFGHKCGMPILIGRINYIFAVVLLLFLFLFRNQCLL